MCGELGERVAYLLAADKYSGPLASKHGQSILYTSAEIIDCIPQRGGGLLRGLHKFEEPQLLHGNGSVHQAHRRFGAIDDQGFVRRQWHQGALW
jgi:hypothetical protein